MLGDLLQQDPTQQQGQQSQINWGVLNGIQPTHVMGQLEGAQAGAQSGISDLFAGLKSLIGGRGNTQSPQQPNQPNQTYGGSYTSQTLQQNSLQQATASVGIFNSALKEVGLQQGDPALTSYLSKANPGLDPNKTPWCAGFVGSVLNANGLKGTGSLAAKSYLNYGTPVQLPTKGDIAVFNDMTGNNDPTHGHIGFVDHIDPATNRVYVVGGNQDHSVSTKAYPMNMVAGFRHPPSADQVQQYAQQNGIQTPQQLSQVNKQNMSNSTNLSTDNSPLKDSDLTTKTIAKFEEFTPKSAWDVNAYRAGYGSDTTTTADGRVVKVTPGMRVSQEDAQRDLTRRTQQFASFARQQVGTNVWDKFTPQTQAALTSIAYNYGSIPKKILPIIQSGNTTAIIKAVQGLGSDNRGVNRGRRMQEASLIQSSMNNQPTTPFAPPPTQPTPQEHKLYEDKVRELDNGKDDYSQNNTNSIGA